MISGIFYLLYTAGVDMFFYVKILCDYKMDDELNDKMVLEDNK
jgi:hypothetical protein